MKAPRSGTSELISDRFNVGRVCAVETVSTKPPVAFGSSDTVEFDCNEALDVEALLVFTPELTAWFDAVAV